MYTCQIWNGYSVFFIFFFKKLSQGFCWGGFHIWDHEMGTSQIGRGQLAQRHRGDDELLPEEVALLMKQSFQNNTMLLRRTGSRSTEITTWFQRCSCFTKPLFVRTIAVQSDTRASNSDKAATSAACEPNASLFTQLSKPKLAATIQMAWRDLLAA